MADAAPDPGTAPGLNPVDGAADGDGEIPAGTGAGQAMSARIAQMKADLYRQYPPDRVKAAESLAELGQEARDAGDTENTTKVIAALQGRRGHSDPSGPARDAVTRALLLLGAADAEGGINRSPSARMMPTGGNTNYNAPVIIVTGGRAQIAWNNKEVSQVQDQGRPVALGYEALAEAVAGIQGRLPNIGLAAQDHEDAEAAASEILVEITQKDPDRGKIRRGLSALKGYLAPLATGLVTGAGEGLQEWAKTAIQHLGALL